jgi:MFS transporter, DHA2 family, multidrug resistance protein
VDWFGIVLLIAGVGSLQYVLEEGNKRDWFADELLVYLGITAAFSLITMVWWQLSKWNEHPVIDFRVLKNRDLSASIFLFVVMGFGLFGGTFLFPLFTQSILGFKPTDTGLAMLPGGICTAIMAVTVGRLLSGKSKLADPRILILMGMTLFCYSMWKLGHLSTVAGEADARYPLIIRGFAMGLLFVPINNVAYGSIKPKDAQQASGLINLSRQLGGSFGIAILGAYLTRHIAYHRADLATYTVPGTPAFDQRYNGAMQMLIQQGHSATEAARGAIALIQGGLVRQAAMLAYNDAWMMILLSFLAVLPAVFLLHKPRNSAVPPADAHYHGVI